MFWRKRGQAVENGSELVKLVEKLGIEKRQFVRVRYPRLASVCKLPEASFQRHKLQVNDISLGGCCLLDPSGFLGASVGGQIEITLHWATGDELVHARLVSRVDHRRHLQFLDLSERRQGQLRKSMGHGERGLTMRRNQGAVEEGPKLDANELWSSALGDTLVLESSVHRLGSLRVEDQEILFFRGAKPTTKNKQACTKAQFEQVILFLVNVPNPSPELSALIVDLETLFVGDPAGDLK